MLFNSLHFLLFFPVVVLVYLLVPRRWRYLWLLGASYYFYMGWNPKYALLIAFSTVTTYGAGRMLDKIGQAPGEERRKLRKKKWCVFVSFLINIGILFFFKYFDFALENVNRILAILHITVVEKPFDVLLPVGISFYTFQALGYTVDVYRGEIRAEKNLLRYGLFVSFFPQLVAGPIERSKNLLTQVQELDRWELWDLQRIRDGLLLMLWGFFQKLMIADRAAIGVNAVYSQYQVFGGGEILLATLLFAFQIYCDFDAYSNIARGAAKVCGFQLMVNFRQPYFSRSVGEFWRRWHISLSTWFRDYLYIPLGGSRVSPIRHWLNLMVVFLVSGVWHGANWHFILWGGLHGAFQVIGRWKDLLLGWLGDRLSWGKPLRLPAALQVLGTFVLVDLAWLVFRVNSLGDILGILRTVWQHPGFVDPAGMQMVSMEWVLLAISLAVLVVVDVLHARGISLGRQVAGQCLLVRMFLYTAGIGVILVFGVYGAAYDTSQFLYFQF
ncbi:MAG: MBOAT family protein [Lachnospiraceae bacterium]|nr:MBOAT family protein [Lachnospiraceae bacterium]